MSNFLKKISEGTGLNRAQKAFEHFTIGEKTIFLFLATIMAWSSFSAVSKLNGMFTSFVPAKGGALTEGIIGSPRFINPVLATSDADRDLSALIFSGLLRASADNSLVNDLAENLEISEDGLVYTVTIKQEAFFHDKTPITADDVIFTVEKAKDPVIKSPKRAEWEGVRVEKVNEKVVSFILDRPYFPFLENLTLGILPKNQWKNAGTDEFTFSLKNISPVGSGPYKISKIEKNEKDIPVTYRLVSFSKYSPSPANIKNLTVRLYSNETEMMNAWRRGEIESMGGITPNETAKLKSSEIEIKRLKLPRVYGIFFNQNQSPVFVEKAVRQSLDMVLDKEKIVNEVLYGYGTTLSGPLPKETSSSLNQEKEILASSTERIATARKVLQKAGWTPNSETGIMEKKEKTKKGSTLKILSFTLSAPNVPELKKAAELAISDWRTLGAEVELKLYELNDLHQNIIRPRKYDAVLFGQIIGRNPDLFAFWHSSQRNDPGYNIALYTNSKVDKMIENLNLAKNAEEQEKIVNDIYAEITADFPAVFLYAPDYLYIFPKKVLGFTSTAISTPYERFSGIKEWHVERERVWNFMSPDKPIINVYPPSQELEISDLDPIASTSIKINK